MRDARRAACDTRVATILGLREALEAGALRVVMARRAAHVAREIGCVFGRVRRPSARTCAAWLAAQLTERVLLVLEIV